MSIPKSSMIKADAEIAIARALRNHHIIDGGKNYIIIAPHAQTIQGEFKGPGTYKFQGAAEIKLDTGSEEGASCVKDIKGDAEITASESGEPVAKINSVSLVK